MKKAIYTPRARADLKDISRYTDKMWGREQRLRYMRQIKDKLSYLASKPEMGKGRPEILGCPYSYHQGRHVIFYQTIPEGIEIIRVLHDSMDFQRHFT